MVGFFEALVEGGVEVFEGHLVNGVCEFVDADRLGIVGIAGVVEEVFLAAGNGGALAGGSEPTGAAVPEFGWREVGVLRDVAGALAGGHDGIAHFVFGELFENVGPFFEHGAHGVFGFLEGGGVDFI